MCHYQHGFHLTVHFTRIQVTLLVSVLLTEFPYHKQLVSHFTYNYLSLKGLECLMQSRLLYEEASIYPHDLVCDIACFYHPNYSFSYLFRKT
jgi:hypothetical protein